MTALGPQPARVSVLPSVRVPVLAQTWPGPMVDGFVVLSADDARAGGLSPAPLALPEGQGGCGTVRTRRSGGSSGCSRW